MPIKGHNLSLAGIVAESADGIQLELNVRENLPNNRIGAVVVIPDKDKGKLSTAVEKAWKDAIKDLDKGEVGKAAEPGRDPVIKVEDDNVLLIFTVRQHTVKGHTRIVHINDAIREHLGKSLVKAYRASSHKTDK